MCLGVPGQIVALFPGQNDSAAVNISGVKRDIDIALLENEMGKPGDWVLLHVGFTMAKMDKEEVRASLAFLLVGNPMPRIVEPGGQNAGELPIFRRSMKVMAASQSRLRTVEMLANTST